MRVLLVLPDISEGMPWTSTPEAPLGLASIAAYLEEDHEVRIIDNFLEKKNSRELARSVKEFAPDAVGISMTSFSWEKALSLANAVKKIDGATNVFAGGPHASLFPHDVLAARAFDTVVVGEGEFTTPEYLRALEKKRDLRKVRGLVFKKNRRIVASPPRPFIQDLDSLKPPARHLLKIRDYPEYKFSTALSAPVLTMCTSRGCPYNCLYCSSPTIWGRSWRSAGGKRIADEIESLVDEYGARSIKFHEDHFTFDKRRVLDFCREMVRRKIDVEWQCESRVNNIDRERLRAMKRAGCKIIWYGIESGTQKILDFYRKGITLQQARDAVRMAKDEGIHAMGSFIIGAPPESVEEMEETIRFGLGLGLEDVYFNILVAFPGTDLHKYVSRHKMVYARLPGGLLEVEGIVPRELVSELRLKAQKKVLYQKFKRKWPKLLAYYLTHPWALGSERARRLAGFMLKR